MDLGTIDAHDRRIGADDWSGWAQMGSRRATSAPLSSISLLVESAQRFCIARRASVIRMRVAANTEPRTVPAIFERPPARRR